MHALRHRGARPNGNEATSWRRAAPFLALLHASAAFGSGTTTPNGTTQCTDPCIQAARSAFRDGSSSASGAFEEALDGCIERDHVCVGACRSQRFDCRDGTGVGEALAACGLRRAMEKARCRARFPVGSIRRASCLDRAEVQHFRCRREARRAHRRGLRGCESGFQGCVDACGGGEPPLGSGVCKADARSALRTVTGGVRQTFQQTTSACIGKDVMCVPDCSDARETCNGPAEEALDASLAACTNQQSASLAACATTQPAGGAQLQQCVRSAQAAATDCRDAAIEAGAPAFAPCTQQFLACLKACPPA